MNRRHTTRKVQTAMGTRPAALVLLGAISALMVGMLPKHAAASCGAEECPLDGHGHPLRAGPFGFDLSVQYIDQDRVQIGTRRAAVGELSSPEDEVRTTSRIWTLNGRANLAPRLGLTIALPYVDRRHQHLHNQESRPGVLEDFRYAGLGDFSLTGQWMAVGAEREGGASAMLLLGAKLPTGRRNVEAINGDQPEPPARPGTGSVDFIVGAHFMRPVTLGEGGADAPLFLSAQGRLNGRGTDEYRVGNELQVSGGGTYPLGETIELLGQINMRVRGRDEVGHTDALRDNTGGTWLYASPGLRVRAGPLLGLYGYVQLPIYQRVDGIQLVSPYHLLVGTTYALGR